MNSSRHLRVLAVLLAVIGLGVTAYQIFILKTPLRENELTDLWTVDARISYSVGSARPVELEFYLPTVARGYEIADELFIANGYGQSVFDNGENRLVVWTARKVSGKQTIFYRLNLAHTAAEQPPAPGELVCTPQPVSEKDKLAVDALLTEIRQKSADTISFIHTAIHKVDDEQDSNVKLLLRSDKSEENRVRVLEHLLSQARIPIQAVHTLKLSTDGVQVPELWLRSYIEVTKKGETDWYYFNGEVISQGLPENRLLWWVGNEPLLKASQGVRPQVDFSIDKNELSARSLERISQGGDISLYSMPLSTQFAYKLMLIIPLGVFLILVLRNIVGMETLGTFTPVLIALAFRETGLMFGAVFFSVIISLGLLIRAYLEQLKLQMLPRLSVVLTVVILLIIAGSMLCHKLGFDKGLSITLFPMVIVTMAIERLSVTWEERGGSHAFRVAVGTLIAASGVFLVLNYQPLTYFVFTFPAILLALIAVMLGLGRYRGYRLVELFRFRDLMKQG